jgi:hypothetical protein
MNRQCQKHMKETEDKLIADEVVCFFVDDFFLFEDFM